VNVAFYAPLKAPDHPTPSGDRTMARMLMRALKVGGHQVTLASRLRSLERHGDAAEQARIRGRGQRSLQRVLQRYRGVPTACLPQVWFTYHLYHKAPDLLGPAVSRALGVPYIVAEASHAPKQAGGPWDKGYRAAAEAIEGAARIITLNPVDEACVRALLGGDGRISRLAPFIDARASVARVQRGCGCGVGARKAARETLRETTRAMVGAQPGEAVLVTVAMMRRGDKLASYRLLAAALNRLRDRPWRLLIIGDGPARDEVRALFAALGARVHLAGQVRPDELCAQIAGCDLHLWPAVNEAWGMAFLEAAAAGVASVAGNEGGVDAVVHQGDTGVLVPPRDVAAFADAVALLLVDTPRREALGRRARQRVLDEHAIETAARHLDSVLADAMREVRHA